MDVPRWRVPEGEEEEEWGDRSGRTYVSHYLGGWKAIALGFAECLWSGRLTGHHFSGRAFINNSRVFQATRSWIETTFESPKTRIIARLFH